MHEGHHEHAHEHTYEHCHEHSHEHGEGHDHPHDHEHMHDHDHDHGHTHTHGPHGHTHSHEHTKAVLNRLSRAIGHLQSVKRMVEDGRDCSEVLIQIAAAKSAINNVGREILKEHIDHCIVDAVKEGNQKALSDLNDALDRFMK